MINQCIKSCDEFYLEVERKNGKMVCVTQPLLETTASKTKIYLDGVVYCNEVMLDKLADSDVKNAVQGLDGFYSLILVNDDQVSVITDRSNSHKVFYTVDDGKICISNNIDKLIPYNYKLDIGG